MVNGLCLYSSPLISFITQALTSQHSLTNAHIQTIMPGGFSTKGQPAYQKLICTYSYTAGAATRSNFWWYLAQGYFNMKTREDVDRTTNRLERGQPSLRPELQPPRLHVL